MKKIFTQKYLYIIACSLLLSLYSNAEDLTHLLVNPSFEFIGEGIPNPENNTQRNTPYGWKDTQTESGSIVPPSAGGEVSYGINQDGICKDGLNLCWVASFPFPKTFTLYQEVVGLPAGKYIVSCRMIAFAVSGWLTNQRLFANNNVQYFGKESDYRSDITTNNLTPGEVNTFAGWDLPTGVGSSDAVLKPLFVVVDIAEGETLKLGIKTSGLKKDGTVAGGTSNTGWFKVDDFRIRTYPEPEDPNDYTHKIVNPSFELQLLNGQEKQITVLNTPVRETPYGWTDDGGVELLRPTSGNISYGVNSDANNMDGAMCCWAMKSPMPDYYNLYQDIIGLPAGKYNVSCTMFVENGCLTNQCLFANEKTQYYATEWDYYLNVDFEDDNISFADWSTGVNGPKTGRLLNRLSVDVDVKEDGLLRIGMKTSNRMADGVRATNNTSGWFKVDDFRMRLIESGNTSLDLAYKSTCYSLESREGGFVLMMKEAVPAYLQVISLSGRKLYSSFVNDSETWIELPSGFYIVQLIVDKKMEVTKVWIK